MSNPLLENGLAAMARSRRVSSKILENIPDDKYLYQPFPDTNHAMWTMGHLACADEFFLNKLGGKPFKKFEQWNKIFFKNSKPSPKASDYPPLAEVKEAFATNRENLVAWFKSLNEAALLKPLPEEIKGFALHHADAMNALAWHEGLHTGQLTVVRKSLGLAPIL